MNVWIKVFQGFCSFPPRAQLSFYCSGYIHFVIFLPVCLLLVNIKYLLLLYSLTSSALLSHSLHSSPPGLFSFIGEKVAFEESLFWWCLVFFHPYFFFSSLFRLWTEKPWFPICLCLHFVLSFTPFLSLSFLLSLSQSHAFVPNPPPPPPCMLKYSVKEGSRGGIGGERVARRGGIGGGGGGNIDVKSAAVVMIFCSLFLGTSGPLRATVSSTVFTGSWREECGWRSVKGHMSQTLSVKPYIGLITVWQFPLQAHGCCCDKGQVKLHLWKVTWPPGQ